MKYRAICPVCNKSFDSRNGYLLNGKLVCHECRPTQYDTWISYPDDANCDMGCNDMKRYPDFCSGRLDRLL